MKTLELLPIPPIILDQTVRFSCQLIRKTAGKTESVQELWYEIPKENYSGWDDRDAEPYLMVNLLQAMYEARRVVARGKVSGELLSNLTELCDFWNHCLPDVFKKIDILCDQIDHPDGIVPLNKAIATFSGGLDGTFLVWRHMKKKAGYRNQPLSACVMIHGFDIPLSNDDFFKKSVSLAQKTLDTVGLPLIQVRTNFQELFTIPLGYFHNTVLTSSLQFLKSHFGIALIASDEPYNHLLIPWGSSPLNNHLLSSKRLKVLHDGAAYTRSEKAKMIHHWKEGVDYLRVCWNTDVNRPLNCGRCEKCLRTMACFAVNRLPIPKSLNGSLEDLNREMHHLRIGNPGQLLEWTILLKEARQNKIQDPWVKQIQRLFMQYQFKQMRKRVKKYLKKRLFP